MFIRQLSDDPTFTPLQRAYVLGFKPSRITVKVMALAAFFTTAQGLAAAAFFGSAMAYLVSPWATNLARFWAWAVACLWGLSTFVITVDLLCLGWKIVEAEERNAAPEKLNKLRNKIDGMIPGSRRIAMDYVVGTLARIALVSLIVGLGMAGYMFLPGLLVVEWAVGTVIMISRRETIANGVKVLVPDAPVEPAKQPWPNGKAATHV